MSTVNLSRATRRQLVMLDLIEGVIDAERAANPSNVRIDQILRRLSTQQQRIRSMLFRIGKRGQMVFSTTKEYQRYQREIVQVRETILAQWPEEELDGREYVNALLAYCDRLKAGRTAQEWGEMEGLLQKLYEEMDPALSAESQMDAGEMAGEVLKEVMEGLRQ
jgi:flagellar biosynthesis chaperone FliJ